MLSSHRGKDVVVLDFWAVRCPPCRAALPALTAIAEEYKGREMVFYAVNTEDSGPKIERFLDQLGTHPTVALDAGGPGSRLYGVSYIPQEVVIGKDGKVQSIHSGFDQDSARQLRAEVDALQRGRDISQMKVRKAKRGLACREVVFRPSEIHVGDEVTFSCAVENMGTGDVEAGTYRLVMEINGNQRNAYVGVGPKAIREGEEVVLEVGADRWSFEMTEAGEHSYRAIVLPGETIDDVNLRNNVQQGKFSVLAAEAGTAEGNGKADPFGIGGNDQKDANR